ncbi:MAG: hypothetical protein PVG99_01295 [Desulfobacteraceae bacterium]|jgi:hypothetical protein
MTKDRKAEKPSAQLEKQVALVMEAIKREPGKRKQILTGFLSNFFDAVKETLKKQGRITPIYIIMADTAGFGVPPVTAEVTGRAKELNAEAVVSLEGFQCDMDISDVVYHVSMSAPSIGVMGWVLKVKLSDEAVMFIREMPYLFDSSEKVKSLGELVAEMEAS